MQRLMALLLLAWASTAAAQQLSTRLVHDSVRLGDAAGLWLLVQRPAGMQLLVPDSLPLPAGLFHLSTASFSTALGDSAVQDSVLYSFQVLGPGPSYALRVPVLRQSQAVAETLWVQAPPLHLQPDTLVHLGIGGLQPNSAFAPLPAQENWPKLVARGLAAALALLLLLLLAGRMLRQRLAMVVLWYWHVQFRLRFRKVLQGTQKGAEPELLLQALQQWKTHLERLGIQGFSTYTTRDIAETLNDRTLNDALQAVDLWVYGGVKSQDTAQIVQVLMRRATAQYLRRKEELIGG